VGLIAMDTFVLDVRNIFELSDAQFYQLCRQHPDIRFERSAKGELIIMPPTGGVSGNRNFSLTGQVASWVDRHPELGVGFDSSTCFKLPNGADRAPDVAWVRMDRWNALTPEQQEKFPPIAPDFVIELRSRTDDLATLRSKMQEYANNGVSLGVLINPQDKQVEIYRPNQANEVFDNPASIDCTEVLPGFVINLQRILS
jgi:Uma2 family endonuclease